MNSYTIKVLGFLLALFVLIIISSQFYLAFKKDYKTETAVSYSTVEKVSFKGVFVRNEQVINYSGSGVIGYPHSDGSKIAKNSVVAYVYTSESDIEKTKKIKTLQEELASLNKVTSPGTIEAAQPELISKLISERYRESVYAAETGNYSKLSSEKQRLSEYMNVMSLVTEKESNFDEIKTSLEAQITNLQSQMNSPVDSVYTDESGYFVSYTDGYEDVLTLGSTGNLIVNDVKKIISNPKTKVSSSVGKVIDGYKWKLVGVVDNSKNLYSIGAKVSLNFLSCPEPITAVIEEIIPSDDGSGESVIILSSDKLTYELVQHRVERVEMVSDKYEGIYVPRKAIRFNKAGEKGVYVKMGQGIIFKKLDIIYEGDDYILSANSGQSDFVMLYDDVITEGITSRDELSASLIDDSDDSDEETEETIQTSVTENVIVSNNTSETTKQAVENEQ